MNNLSYLLKPWIPCIMEIPIRNITLDSRSATYGDLFIAIQGYNVDAGNFILQAISNGVAAVIAETTCEFKNGYIQNIHGVPIIYLAYLKERLSMLAGRFYQNPANKLKLIGVTGTNGKTTITHLIAQWANLLGEISGIIGTMGYGIYGKPLIPTKNTTNSAVILQNILHNFVENKVKLTAMEISSHGLVQHRVSALPLTAGVFTNLSHDHLDYHGNMKNYELAKWMMFSANRVEEAIINVDDKIGTRWATQLRNAVVVTLKNNLPSVFHNNRWLKATAIDYNNGVQIYFNSSWGSGKIDSGLIGSFNASNLLLSLATLLALKYPLSDLIASAPQLKSVCGRMEIFTAFNKPFVVIDYAHTPDALEKALSALRSNCKGKLWCIFGCGGNRDQKKRPLMGAIAEKFADVIVITDDNPRKEKSMSIINDILLGLINPDRAYVIPRRIRAITNTVMQAKINDVVLIAGKGHENYQIIGNQIFNYSDRHIIAHLLGIKI